MNVMENATNQPAWNQISEVELVYRSKVRASLRPILTNSKDVYDLLVQSWDKDKIELQEQFKVLLLNKGNKALGIFEVSTGGVAGTVADPKLIFMAALKANACNVILAHNHPSGNLKPSRADEELTQKIKQGGKLLEINVLDHLIVSPEGYYSFADEGLL
jgi:DNA repair protein RadC